MKTVIAILALVGLSGALSYTDVLEAEWETYKLEYDKVYESEEEELLRKLIFIDNKRQIDRHNQRYRLNMESYEMGVNQFTDMLDKEFESLMLGSMNITESDADLLYTPDEAYALPADIDWRNRGAVTPVKNQGKCGACWSFSATGTLEGMHFLKTGKLVSLSEQNLVDCSTTRYFNRGCYGGMPDRALNYVIDNGGIDTEYSYTYEAKQLSCRYDPFHIGAQVAGVVRVPAGEPHLAVAVASKGPISVGIYASNNFRNYRDGVLDDRQCNKRPNHAVLVVGFGRDPQGGDFWLVKNSWGASWGDGGYIRMSRNRSNQCGIASNAVYPLV
ncbi:PREDICTED: cathepsin L1-like [Drosophila arizonae]|uniref:Cathepsin L1-like n=1 Tax=Drosophila arizonae TaxID=7263 RepID=A0ABM1PN96_DROAR|nr:PREDICTED: cathepsin L1-like [Drosophila arizonae]